MNKVREQTFVRSQFVGFTTLISLPSQGLVGGCCIPRSCRRHPQPPAPARTSLLFPLLATVIAAASRKALAVLYHWNTKILSLAASSHHASQSTPRSSTTSHHRSMTMSNRRRTQNSHYRIISKHSKTSDTLKSVMLSPVRRLLYPLYTTSAGNSEVRGGSRWVYVRGSRAHRHR